MEEKLLQFIHELRRAGVRVSTAEALDGFEAVKHVDLGDRPAFRDGLRASLVKEGGDISVFDSLFEAFFDLKGPRPPPSVERDGEPGDPFGEERERMIAALRGAGGEESMLDVLARLASQTGFAAALQRAGESAGLARILNGLQIGFYTRRLIEELGVERMAQALARLLEAMRREGAPEAEVSGIEQWLERLMRFVRDEARRRVEQELKKNSIARETQTRRQTLAEKSFFELSPREMNEMNEVVAELARKLKTVMTLRKKRNRKGGLDVQRTIRRNLRYGGVPMEIIRRRKRIEKPNIVNLCDVSGSVRYVAHFMLQFMYSIQDQFSRVRSFVFVRDLHEVTDSFCEFEIRDAIARILTSPDIDYYNNSDFGHMFGEFAETHLGDVGRRTTVIILGDARNNYNDPRTDALARIREKAKRVIWLNPENRTTWGFGDSVMYQYLPRCTYAREVRNLTQLIRAVDEILL